MNSVKGEKGDFINFQKNASGRIFA